MKKTAALLLALLLCLACFPAQAADKLITYTHPTWGYSFQYPPEWLVVDSSNIDAYIEGYRNGTVKHGAVDAETLEQLVPDVREYDCVFLFNLNANYIVVNFYYFGSTLTAEQFNRMMMPTLIKNLKQVYTDGEFLTDGEVAQYGDNRFALLAIDYLDNGMKYCDDFLYLCRDGYLFDIVITSQEVIAPMETKTFLAQTRKLLASLTFPENLPAQ